MIRTLMLIVIGLWLGGADWSLGAFAADGKALFAKSCAGCHGADGKGNQKMAAILGQKSLSVVGKDTTKKSDEQLLKVIAEGAGKMPASKLTKGEQKEVLQYIRTLAQ